MRRIALVTESRFESPERASQELFGPNVLLEDQLLATSLRERNIDSLRVSWSNPTVDWNDFDAILLRTPWDYFQQIGPFTDWIAGREMGPPLLNPPATVRWNLNKHYLRDLQQVGIRTVPTQWIVPPSEDASIDWESYFDLLQGDEVILKPCISAGSEDTYRLRKESLHEWEAAMNPIVAKRPMMLQEFQPSILDKGEVSLIAWGGRVSHAVRKRGKSGDFRIQFQFGGSANRCVPTAAEIAFAEEILKKCQHEAVYARVDLVYNLRSQPQVMELELIEPELWLRLAPESSDGFANAIVERLDR